MTVSSEPVHKLSLLFVSTPVGPLGTGIGGGVELTILNSAKSLINRGHRVKIVVPKDSNVSNVEIVEIEGKTQNLLQNQTRASPILMPADAVLAHMWDYVRSVHSKFDLIVNFAYDWLPFFLTSWLSTPIIHWISMGSLTSAMDAVIQQVVNQFPHSIGVHTKAQANTFSFSENCYVLGNSIDLSLYQFNDTPVSELCWIGRLASEKALEDAVTAAQYAGLPLKIMGYLQDPSYFEKIRQNFSSVSIEYCGFLSTVEMQQKLRLCKGLLVTPRWVEAFGNVVIESLACGVPVIAYRRGGPAEIIRDGETGWLVEPDRIEDLVDAIHKLSEIDRLTCRKQAELEYSLDSLGKRLESWFKKNL